MAKMAGKMILEMTSIFLALEGNLLSHAWRKL